MKKELMTIGLILSLCTSQLQADVLKDAKNAIKEYNPKSLTKANTPAFEKITEIFEKIAQDKSTNNGNYLIKLVSTSKTPLAIRGMAMHSIIKMGDKDEISALLKKEVAKERCCPQLIDVLARLKRTDCVKLFALHLKSRDQMSLMAALMGLTHCGGIKDAKLIKAIGSMSLQTKNQSVRWACSAALGGSLNKLAVPILIKNLDLPGGYKDARKALIRISGKNLTGKTTWETWWKENAKTFTAVDEFELAEKIIAAEQAQSEFYGLSVEGNRIVFFLDGSKSMNGERWTSLQQEASSMLDGLDDQVEYALVFFPVQAFPKKGFVRKKKDEAMEFIKYMELKGSTPMGIAAIYMLKQHLNKGKDLPDTCYILSDGAPTDMAPEEFEALMLALFPGNCIRIHSINLGSKGGRKMLGTVSREHGGILSDPGDMAKQKVKDDKKAERARKRKEAQQKK